jgi:bifunctional non-homologous end joining protein LigD
MILEGEIVALDSEGIPRFQLLQKWQKRPTAPVVYYVFDVLWSEGGRHFQTRLQPTRAVIADHFAG